MKKMERENYYNINPTQYSGWAFESALLSSVAFENFQHGLKKAYIR